MLERFASDPHRPRYHFLAPSNWLNDPNGVVQWKGEYHLFYQHNPAGPLFGKIHWGHAKSQDLVHWTHLPIALSPTPGTVDEDGCWSGCLVNNNGTPTIIYSGNRNGEQLPCLATGSADLVSWQKYADNPIIPARPPDLELTDFRDHCVWQEDGFWYQLIGTGIKDVGGAVLLYRSTDLLHWEYLYPLFVGDSNVTGTMWECPDFFPLGDKHVLLISPMPNAISYYFVGTYAEQRFTPELMGLLDYGRHFYAPQSIRDEQGRRMLWAWLREGRSDAQIQAAGWAGMLSLPRVLSLRSDNTLQQQPAPELEALRSNHFHAGPLQLSSTVETLTTLQSATLEIQATFLLGDAATLGLTLSALEHNERIVIKYVGAEQRLIVDNGLDSEEGATPAHEQESGPLALKSGETLTLRLFLDGSVLEVFANETFCLSERIYLAQGELHQLQIFAQSGQAELTALDVWHLRSIWPSSN